MVCKFPHTLASHHANLCFMPCKCKSKCNFFLLIPGAQFNVMGNRGLVSTCKLKTLISSLGFGSYDKN